MQKNHLKTPAAGQHPLALKINWCPVSPPRTDAAVYRLTPLPEGGWRLAPLNRLERFNSLLGPAAVVLAGGGTLGILFSLWNRSAWFSGITGVGLLALSAVIGWPVWRRRLIRPRALLFDAGTAACYRTDGRNREELLPFRDIAALQLLAKSRCYELNAVKPDGHRVNLFCHLQLEALRRDAGCLAEFLDVPLWERAEVQALYLNQSRGA